MSRTSRSRRIPLCLTLAVPLSVLSPADELARELGMNIRSERLLVLKHNPCSDHVRAPLTPPMTIVRIKYMDMNFFETYEFSPQLTTRLSRKPISSPRREPSQSVLATGLSLKSVRHNRTQTVCELACRKRIDVLDLPPDIQPHSRRSTSRTIIVSKIVHGKTLHKFGACNRYTDSNLEEDDRDGFSFVRRDIPVTRH
ncbi:hypothetical protein YC2023_108869 [Brassica napus]